MYSIETLVWPANIEDSKLEVLNVNKPSLSLSQTSFDYSVINFDVIKKINVGDQNNSNEFNSSSLSSVDGIIGSPYRNTSFETGIIYKNRANLSLSNSLNDGILFFIYIKNTIIKITITHKINFEFSIIESCTSKKVWMSAINPKVFIGA